MNPLLNQDPPSKPLVFKSVYKAKRTASRKTHNAYPMYGKDNAKIACNKKIDSAKTLDKKSAMRPDGVLSSLLCDSLMRLSF